MFASAPSDKEDKRATELKAQEQKTNREDAERELEERKRDYAMEEGGGAEGSKENKPMVCV